MTDQLNEIKSRKRPDGHSKKIKLYKMIKRYDSSIRKWLIGYWEDNTKFVVMAILD
jgi:hypothetical protein